MPTYNYQCPTCKATASVTVLIADTPKTPGCLACLKPMQRVYGGIAVTFKGKGWGKD